jgi:hypothetical protein
LSRSGRIVPSIHFPARSSSSKGDIILTRCWTSRQANHTLTLPETRVIEINLDGLPPTPAFAVDDARADLGERVRRFCGGRIRREILSQEHPRMSLTA